MSTLGVNLSTYSMCYVTVLIPYTASSIIDPLPHITIVTMIFKRLENYDIFKSLNLNLNSYNILKWNIQNLPKSYFFYSVLICQLNLILVHT